MKKYFCGFLCLVLLLTMFSPLIGKAENIQPTKFFQVNSAWYYYPYSSHNDSTQIIGKNGCGITAAAMIINTWYDDTVTPIEMAELSKKLHTVSYNGGTKEEFFIKLAEEYPFSNFYQTIEMDKMIKCLENEGYVIALFFYSKWCNVYGTAHACVIWKYDGSTFFLNDPAWPRLERQTGTFEEIENAAITFFCYEK